MLLFDLIHWVRIDRKRAREDRKNGVNEFKEFGVKVFCGRQGAGKTIGMVEYARVLKQKYPKLLICSNFECDIADIRIHSLYDLYTIKNGTDGVLFLLDEMQNEFSNKFSKDFPEEALSLITQQRKQRICILCTSQVFSRLAKPLREQCYEVVQCKTNFKRLTRLRCYDALDYNTAIDKNDFLEALSKLKTKWKYTFVQSDDLRNMYDTYSVVERLNRYKNV